ncbi:MAG: ATP-binding protein [Bacillota bacterium]|uniref:DUF815 domain-containing protein n=1 Tax=Thermanaerosceptrum fracticalcis TaxID=1712410 RepID=A0A7G6E2L2_THEFR|nr:ATP-binding protein [Thermanaerosceptrum fracticalcis]QNB46316.1 DUF815 domain-containing protein [Thermanaerosceptrum fracticalcis]
MNNYLKDVRQSAFSLVYYRNILQDRLLVLYLDIVSLLLEKELTDLKKEELQNKYYELLSALLDKGGKIVTTGHDLWRDYVVNLILYSENAFTEKAGAESYQQMAPVFHQLVQHDLRSLQQLACLGGRELRELVGEKLGNVAREILSWEGIKYGEKSNAAPTPITSLLEAFQASADWGMLAPTLAEFYYNHGVGQFAKYHFFRWVVNNGTGRLEGVEEPDKIRLEQLYEYRKEQEKVIQNTEYFLAGFPANNVLLYGDRGTGKSSTVKALINKYGVRGLRLVELQKQDMKYFPEVLKILRKKPQHFIIFIDDLSFEDNENEYRELKALLEGGVEAKPQNVVIYATSNRRHLVKERFSDKEITGYDGDEVRRMDTIQEKLSLADRFGITLTFISPDQKRYLKIVEHMVKERKLEISVQELERRALQWEINGNGRSPRTAKQFVDFLEGQLGLLKGANIS